jgi:hypothetical protein
VQKLFAGVCAAFVVLATAPAAEAVTIRMQADGVVSLGQDYTGVFGLAGQSLVGRAWSFVGDFDLSNAGYDSISSPFVQTMIYGGSAYDGHPGAAPSIGGGAFTLNGHTETISGNWYGFLLATMGWGFSFDQQAVREFNPIGGFDKTMILSQEGSLGPFTLPGYVPPAGDLCESRVCRAQFSIHERTGGQTITHVFASLSPSRTTITVVPEPATWALMIIGFGATGSTLRRRRMAVT